MDHRESPPPSKKGKLTINAAMSTFSRVIERLPRGLTYVSDILSKLVVTTSMEKLEKLVSATDTDAILVCGPHGIGKSTALLWLYCKLQDKEGYDVLTLTFDTLETTTEELISSTSTTSSNNKIVALIELNGISQVTTKQVAKFSLFVSMVRTRNGIIVLGSSGFDAVGHSGDDRPGTKLVNRILLYHGLKKLEMRCSEEEAKEIVELLFPQCKEKHQEILAIANYNPGYIACYKPYESIGIYNECVQRDVLVEWKEIVSRVALTPSNLKRTRQILLCSYYDASITAFNLLTADVAKELPITTYLFHIDERSIPKPNLKLSSGSISDMIHFVSNRLTSLFPQTDSDSAIGHLFEIPALTHLAEGIELDCAAFEERNTDVGVSTRRRENRRTLVLVGKPSQETPRLDFMGTYVDSSTPKVGQLYKCKQGEMGIDAFAMLENEVLLLIQISIQQERHHQKMEHSLQHLPRFALDITKKQITYLYLNPNCSIPATDLYNNFRWIVSKYADWEWLFASLNSQKFLSAKLDILKNMLM